MCKNKCCFLEKNTNGMRCRTADSRFAFVLVQLVLQVTVQTNVEPGYRAKNAYSNIIS